MQVSSLTRSLAQMEEQLRQASEDRVSKMNYRADSKRAFSPIIQSAAKILSCVDSANFLSQ